MTGAPARRYHHRSPLFVPPPQLGAIISSSHRSRGNAATTTVGRGRAGVSASSPPSYIVTDAARARSSAPVPFPGSPADSSAAPDTQLPVAADAFSECETQVQVVSYAVVLTCKPIDTSSISSVCVGEPSGNVLTEFRNIIMRKAGSRQPEVVCGHVVCKS
ncbi:unnamed protein product [Macrosiphum euphorbiae]|uniref:Uncharacterized protein n=1 Tax=Macrosiphum euphorbiae TaxID=13131 RepID=A0AAV0X3T0_9HEMI|nr:unnamed protein product [Macrosiphum euphorbiae]